MGAGPWTFSGWIDDQSPPLRRRTGATDDRIFAGGQVHDVTQASALFADIEPDAVLADEAHDAGALLLGIAEKQAKAVIPSKTKCKVKRPSNWHHYRKQNVIERFFALIE